jgi:hypothetical protein
MPQEETWREAFGNPRTLSFKHVLIPSLPDTLSGQANKVFDGHTLRVGQQF